jgi:hypothetical protein
MLLRQFSIREGQAAFNTSRGLRTALHKGASCLFLVRASRIPALPMGARWHTLHSFGANFFRFHLYDLFINFL